MARTRSNPSRPRSPAQLRASSRGGRVGGRARTPRKRLAARARAARAPLATLVRWLRDDPAVVGHPVVAEELAQLRDALAERLGPWAGEPACRRALAAADVVEELGARLDEVIAAGPFDLRVITERRKLAGALLGVLGGPAVESRAERAERLAARLAPLVERLAARARVVEAES